MLDSPWCQRNSLAPCCASRPPQFDMSVLEHPHSIGCRHKTPRITSWTDLGGNNTLGVPLIEPVTPSSVRTVSIRLRTVWIWISKYKPCSVAFEQANMNIYIRTGLRVVYQDGSLPVMDSDLFFTAHPLLQILCRFFNISSALREQTTKSPRPVNRTDTSLYPPHALPV